MAYYWAMVWRTRVDMKINNVTHRMIIPSTCSSHKSAWVQLHHISCDWVCIKLAPSFIKHNPLDNAWMVSPLCYPSKNVNNLEWRNTYIPTLLRDENACPQIIINLLCKITSSFSTPDNNILLTEYFIVANIPKVGT